MLLFVAHQCYNRTEKVKYPHGSPFKASLSIRGGASMYAIIETGGKQIKVEQGQEVYIEKLAW